MGDCRIVIDNSTIWTNIPDSPFQVQLCAPARGEALFKAGVLILSDGQWNVRLKSD